MPGERASDGRFIIYPKTILKMVTPSESNLSLEDSAAVIEFGSGAVFGYQVPPAGYTTRAVTYSGGLQGFGGNTAADRSATLCTTSKMTLGNNLGLLALPTCSPTAGNADVQFTTMTSRLMEQLRVRYVGAGSSGPSQANRNAYNIVYCTDLPGSCNDDMSNLMTGHVLCSYESAQGNLNI